MLSSLNERRDAFHRDLLATCLTIDEKHVCSNADRSNRLSVTLSLALSERLPGKLQVAKQPQRRQLLKQFQSVVRRFLRETLGQLHQPWPMWSILGDETGLAAYEQYSHLADWDSVAKKNPDLKTSVGDCLILPDAFVLESVGTRIDRQIKTETVSAGDNRHRPKAKLGRLQGSISCKWTLNPEALNVALRHNGRIPHIVVVTGEPLPSRLASLAIGAGDIDKVYHFALPELVDAAKQLDLQDALDSINMLIEGNRLGDIAELPLDLVN
jgi:hypothetical protein